MPETYGLIDGNSFYCSVEAAFDPRLKDVPLIVLSNNDSCTVARSPAARRLGVEMGDPWHLIRHRPECAEVQWFSSNYALYADASRRIYQVLCGRLPRVEPYSIDEMFIDLDVPTDDLVAFCHGLRAEVRRIAKIPTCIGIGPTKTIAKAGNKLAKVQPRYDGVCDLRDPAVRARVYREVPVGEVWGIGGRTEAKLARLGVATVADFVALEPALVRGLLTVVGARIQAELRGVSCLPLALAPATRKGVAVTRCFGRLVSTWADMREAVSAHATRAGEKLREQDLVAGHMAVFLHTHPHNGDPWYSAGHGGRIEPTSDGMALIAEAARMLRPLWREGYAYFKVGVMLSELTPAAGRPRMLFATRDPTRSAKLMAALDAVNARHGRDTLRVLATGIERPWQTRHSRRSRRFTTRLDEVLEATAW